MPKALKPLTPKQQRFLDAYLGEAQLNGSKAATIAGYAAPEVTASQLLRNPKVARELERIRADRAKKDVASRTYKRERLRQIMEGEDDKLAMMAMEIDNKMQQEYVQRIQMNFDGMDDNKLNEESAEIMRSSGWICISPDDPAHARVKGMLE